MTKSRFHFSTNDHDVEISEYYLRGVLNGGKEPLPISQAALELAISAHGDKRRDDGTLYISHPISMACYAIGLKVRNDELIATTLLHDVVEDCGVQIQSVSESSIVRQAVRLMTIEPSMYDLTKADVKRHYFDGLLQCPEALICKVLDRKHNLESSIGVFDYERALKNWRETYYLLLPVVQRAKRSWPEWSDVLHVLRSDIKTNLNWMLDKFGFKEEELAAEYGTLSFEKKTLKAEGAAKALSVDGTLV